MPTNVIKIELAELGFLDFGAVKAEFAKELVPVYKEYLDKGYNASMEYLAKNCDKRLNPSLLVPGARSVLCFLAPYGPPAGGIAGFAQGIDYHIVVKDRLHLAMERLKKDFDGFEGRAFCDSAPVAERYWAAKAGLGFIGKNGFLISPQFGLRTIIGIIICNIPADRFAPHEPGEVTSCGDCGRCKSACPNGALNDGIVDARLCASYHTIESKALYDAPPVEYKDWIFGCEECLNVCPWNKPIHSLSELENKRDYISSLSPEKWSSMSETEFSSRFRDSGLYRTGLTKIKNNNGFHSAS